MSKIKVLGSMELNGKFDIRNRVYSAEGICPTIDSMSGGGREPMILEVKRMDEINVLGNYMPSDHNASRVVAVEGIAPTVMENHGTVTAIIEEKKVDAYNSTEEGHCRTIKAQYYKTSMPNLMSQGAFGATGVLDCEKAIKINQATEQGFALCEIGGGGGLGLSNKQNTQRKSNRERKNMSDSDNGEYP